MGEGRPDGAFVKEVGDFLGLAGLDILNQMQGTISLNLSRMLIRKRLS